mgnify:CR=1 FL=1
MPGFSFLLPDPASADSEPGKVCSRRSPHRGSGSPSGYTPYARNVGPRRRSRRTAPTSSRPTSPTSKRARVDQRPGAAAARCAAGGGRGNPGGPRPRAPRGGCLLRRGPPSGEPRLRERGAGSRPAGRPARAPEAVPAAVSASRRSGALNSHVFQSFQAFRDGFAPGSGFFRIRPGSPSRLVGPVGRLPSASGWLGRARYSACMEGRRRRSSRPPRVGRAQNTAASKATTASTWAGRSARAALTRSRR